MGRKNDDFTVKVALMLQEGLTRAEIARRLGVAKPTITYHCRKLGLEADSRFTRRYSWVEVRSYYDEGHSLRECQERFGFSSASWYEAKVRGDVVPRPRGMPIDELLIGRRNRSHVKQRLIQAGLLPGACEDCGIDSWRGLPLALELHHRNGVADDNRLENLALLCPNCHSQTDTYSGRNRGRSSAA